MKILHVVPCYEPAWEQAGVITALSTLCRGMAAQGADVTVYATNLNPPHTLDVPLAVPVDRGGVQVFYYPGRYMGGLFYSSGLNRAILRGVAAHDIVHVTSHWNLPALPAWWACRQAGVPYVVSPHGSLMFHVENPAKPLDPRWWRRFLWQNTVNRLMFGGAAAVHFTAEHERDVCRPFIGNAQTFVEPNAVHVPAPIDAPVERIRADFGLDPGLLTVSYVGRLVHRKAVDLLVRAVALALERGLELQLALAFPPNADAEKDLRQLVDRLAISGRVHFLGFIDAPTRDRLLSATDCVSLVSRSGDNFGYTAVEAMALGVPVLLSPSVGIQEAVLDAGAGLVVDISAEAIAGGLLALLGDLPVARKMGAAARRMVLETYGVQAVAGRMLEHYKRIVRQ